METVIERRIRKGKSAAQKTPYLDDATLDNQCPAVKFMVITPKFAAKILEERNSTPAGKAPAFTNRNLRVNCKKTQRLILDIEDGNFYPTALKFGTNGKLLDGQHRVYAISKQNKNVKMIVESGADVRSMAKLDRGKARTMRDVLGLSLFQKWGLTPTGWAKAQQVGIRWQAWSETLKSHKSVSSGGLRQLNPTDEEMEKFFEAKKKSIQWAAGIVPTGQKGQPFKRMAFMFPLAVMHSVNPSKALLFVNEAIGGGQPKSCPTSKARNIILGEKGRGDETYISQAQRVLFCMQRYIDGRKVRRVGSTTKIKG
mgnify:CR=1 FL=1|jgi:hypothetical protein